MVSNETPIKVEKFFKLNLEMTRPQTSVSGGAAAGTAASLLPDSASSISSETQRIILLIWTDDHTDATSSNAVCDIYTTGSATAVGYEM